MSLKGIDVSHYNAPINWNKVKSQIDFAILKLGNIGDNKKFWLDDTFESNYNSCKALGIPVGVYVYSYTNNLENAKLAGQEVANYVRNLNLELPVYLDMEDDEIKVEGKAKLSQLITIFNEEIEKAGKWAGIYANLDWFNNYINIDLRKRFTTWIAHVEYPDNLDKYKGQYDMFQYSWKGKIDGCNGNDGKVDMNIMYRNLIGEIAGSKPEPQPIPTPTPEPTPQPVLKYKVGDKVKVSSYYASSTDTPNKAIIRSATGTITKVLTNGCRNPYLLDDGNIGWCNNGDIRGYADSVQYYPACNQSQKSLVDALKSIGVDSSFNNRKNIARKNGIPDYEGTARQNEQLLSKLKAGRLVK